MFRIPGLQRGSLKQSSIKPARVLYKEARPALVPKWEYMQGKPLQDFFVINILSASGVIDLETEKRKEVQILFYYGHMVLYPCCPLYCFWLMTFRPQSLFILHVTLYQCIPTLTQTEVVFVALMWGEKRSTNKTIHLSDLAATYHLARRRTGIEPRLQW